MASDLFVDRGAVFSECRRYRYRLWRVWDGSRPPLVAIMLNPSIADADVDDPTVMRMTTRARQLGMGGIRVGNIFALVSTDPAALRAADDPVGPDNDEHLAGMCGGAGMVLCGWGVHGSLQGMTRPRGEEVIDLLAGALGHDLYALRLVGGGQPSHPLYLPYALQPRRWIETGGRSLRRIC